MRRRRRHRPRRRWARHRRRRPRQGGPAATAAAGEGRRRRIRIVQARRRAQRDEVLPHRDPRAEQRHGPPDVHAPRGRLPDFRLHEHRRERQVPDGDGVHAGDGHRREGDVHHRASNTPAPSRKAGASDASAPAGPMVSSSPGAEGGAPSPSPSSALLGPERGRRRPSRSAGDAGRVPHAPAARNPG